MNKDPKEAIVARTNMMKDRVLEEGGRRSHRVLENTVKTLAFSICEM